MVREDVWYDFNFLKFTEAWFVTQDVVLLLFSHEVMSESLNCSMPGFLIPTISWSLLKLMFIESVMPSKHFILCHILLLPAVFPCIRVISNVSTLRIRWPRHWSSASASVLPVNIQGWFLIGLTDLTSLLPQGLSRVFSSTTVWKHHSSVLSLLCG